MLSLLLRFVRVRFGLIRPRIPLQGAEAPSFAEIPYLSRFTFKPNTLEVVSGSASYGINALPDWSLSGSDTLHVQFSGNESARVKLGRSIKVPGGVQSLSFIALAACHRARATLELNLQSEDDGSFVTKSVALDPSCSGGRSTENYQRINISIPSSASARFASLQLIFDGATEPLNEMDSFIFLAEAEISPMKSSNRFPKSVSVFGRQGANSMWFTADLPLLGREGGTEVFLTTGSDRVQLLQEVEGEIVQRQDFGHTLEIESTIRESALIYVNGIFNSARFIEAGRSYLQLPIEALTGELTLFELREETGSRVLFQTYVLAPRVLTSPEVMQRENVQRIPAHLFPQSVQRYNALRSHLADPHSAPLLDRLPFLIESLESGYDRVKLAQLSFPHVDSPEVSIVIPCHNKVEVTFSCLCALLLAHNKASFEVILVDDGSTDDTTQIQDWVDGITVVRNEEAQRFIRACNAGASKARGRYVVLLNNDTEPTIGWLDALLDAFERFPNVGLVGSKLLFPDGRLQDAGGIIWGSGNPWQYGSRQNAWDPRFCYARQADYLPGAALMTTKAIWEEVGGLSTYLEPMYFEDTDFAFKVREAGYSTWFVPSSVVYHNEGTTSGTDTSSGYKRFQEVNRPKFKRRWAKSFANHGVEGRTPDLEKDRGIVGRVLFIDYTTPRPDQDAGSYAAIQEIRLVQSLGYKVTFLPENLAHFGSATEDLERMGVEMVYGPFHLSIADFLRKRAGEFDAFYLTRYHVAENVLPLLRELAPEVKVILNNADLHFLRIMRTAQANDDKVKLAEAARVRAAELGIMQQVDLVLSYNEVEQAVVASHTDEPTRMMSCPWVVEIPGEVPPLEERRGLSFLGSFKHHPNAEGMQWFCKSVMPLLDGPDAHLTIYGAGMDRQMHALASDTVNPVGYVKNIADAYDRHRIFVAPLLSGAGIKGKVLSALAHGIPTVLTGVAAEGIGLRDGQDCLIAETPEEWAKAIRRLMESDMLWQSMSHSARSYVTQRFSFEEGRAKMKAAFEAVDLFGSL
jgi:O-antigen biosynthesis protein